MRKWFVTALLCCVFAVGLLSSTGCGMFSPERNQRRFQVARADWSRIPDEVDWMLGLDEENTIYEDTLPPYRP